MNIETRIEAVKAISDIVDGLYKSGRVDNPGYRDVVRGHHFTFGYANGYSTNSYTLELTSKYPYDQERALSKVGLTMEEYAAICSETGFGGVGIVFYHQYHPDLKGISDEKLIMAARMMFMEWGGFVGVTHDEREMRGSSSRGGGYLVTYMDEEINRRNHFRGLQNKGWA